MSSGRVVFLAIAVILLTVASAFAVLSLPEVPQGLIAAAVAAFVAAVAINEARGEPVCRVSTVATLVVVLGATSLSFTNFYDWPWLTFAGWIAALVTAAETALANLLRSKRRQFVSELVIQICCGLPLVGRLETLLFVHRMVWFR